MSRVNSLPRLVCVPIDDRPRGWGRAVGYASGVVFPLLLGVGFLAWCAYGLTRPADSRPAALYLVSLSVLGIGMLYITVGFTFIAAVARGWVPAAVAVVGRGRTVIFQGGVIPRVVSCAPLSGTYTVARRVSVGRSYWTVKCGERSLLNLGAFDDDAVSEADDRRLASDLERLSGAESRLRSIR